VLANPALSYAQFLLRAVLPTVLHVVVAISAGLAVGSEFKWRSLGAWWDISGHQIASALVGKLLPYYVVHMLMLVLMVGILGCHLRAAAEDQDYAPCRRHLDACSCLPLCRRSWRLRPGTGGVCCTHSPWNRSSAWFARRKSALPQRSAATSRATWSNTAARCIPDRVRSDRDRVHAGPREGQVQELQREFLKAQAVHAQAVQG